MLMQRISPTKVLKIPPASKLLGKNYHRLNISTAYFSDSQFLDKKTLSASGQYILLKGSTGYGGTTAALNDSNFCNIVATPNTSHVINKQKAIGSNGGAAGYRIFYIYEGSRDKWKSVLDYIKAERKFHVYTTFSNLNLALENYFETITTDSVRLIIDEYQQLYAMHYAEQIESLRNKVQGFDNLILTSATHHKYKHHKGIGHLPIKLAYNQTHLEKREVNYIKGAKVGNVISRIKENEAKGISTYIFTNELSIFKSQLNADTLTGQTLGLKIAFYSDTKATKEIDTSKTVHIISSSGYEGIDIYENDCEVIIYGRYTNGKYFDHLLIGENDLYQITGRFRNGYTSASLYIEKSSGFDAYIDTLTADIKEQEKRLEALKEKDIFRYTAALPSIKKAALHDKTLDVYDLIRGHRYSTRFSFKHSTVLAINKRDIAKVKPSKLLKRISLKDANQIAESPTDFLAFKKLDNEDKTKRTGYHSGLNIDDLLIYLIRDFVGGNELLLKAAQVYDGTRNRRDRSNLVKGVFDVLSFYVLSDEYGEFFKKELSERNFNLDYLSKKSKRFDRFQKAMLQHLNGLTWSFLGIDYNIHHKVSNLTHQPTEAQVTRLKSLADKIFNFVWLYNTRLEAGSEMRKQTDAAIKKYIGSEKYLERHPEKDISEKDLLHAQRAYLLDVFLSLRNTSTEFTIKKDGREYSYITSTPSALRKITPSKLIEIDFRQLNPRIAAMWLNSRGYPELLNKVQSGDIYNIEGVTREKAKVTINTALNLHQAHKRREKNFISIGMSQAAASLWASTFAIKGSFYRFAADIERRLIEKVSDYYKEHQTEGFRLHDAYIVQGKTIEAEALTEIELTYQGKTYCFPLGSTEWN